MFKIIFKFFSWLERGMTKSYVSEATCQLNKADKKYGFVSESQKAEIKKHEGIFSKRF